MSRTLQSLSLVALAVYLSAAPLAAQRRMITGPVQESRRAALSGHVHPLARAANDAGAVDPAETIPSVTLMLQQTPEQQSALESLLVAQQDPASKDYHHWLTPEEYADRFGAAQADIDQIAAWLGQHNLRVTGVGRSRTSITFSGTAGDVAGAFQTSFHHYDLNGRRHFANTSEPSLPAAIRVAIRSIHGLNNFRMLPHAVKRATLTPDYTSGAGNHYLSPDDMGTIYNIKALWSAGYDGAGQKIVIAGQTQVDVTDIQKFRARFQLQPADPQMILVPNTKDPGVSKDDLGEADLDIEWAGSTAPNASIIYVYSYDVMDAVQYAIEQNLAPVISVSYGLCEPQTLRSDMLSMQTLARQANAQGITWINAAGDSGGADCYTGTSTSNAGLSVDSPADIPEVTGIGGTTFNENGGQFWNTTMAANGGSALSYIPESVWNDSTSGDPASGGGGASTAFAQPSWQAGLGVPNNGARNVPDISLAASADHDGYLVYNGGSLQVFGGTSAGTPTFAGIAALLNQYLVQTGAQSTPGVGNMNPRLYALAAAGTGAIHDVTMGDNIINITCGARSRNCTPGSFGYAAGQGYDQASGLGSVDAYNLVTAWRGSGATSRAAASLTVQASATSVISTGSVTMTATVTSTTGTTPTGSVIFSAGGKALGSAVLSGSGFAATASLTVSAGTLQLGSNSIVAQYSGDTALNGAAATISIAVTANTNAVPAITAVVNGASYANSYAPGMVLTIFGSNLADTTWTASSLPLATSVSGLTVTIGNVRAPLYYASPTQLNVQIPYETPANQTVALIIDNNGRTTSTTLPIAAAAPGIFGVGTTGARGTVVTLYLTGVGAVSPAIATGAAPAASTPVAQLPVPQQSTVVTIAGINAPIQFVGIPTGLVGVAQINVTIPASVPTGTQSLKVTVGGVSSSSATIVIQ